MAPAGARWATDEQLYNMVKATAKTPSVPQLLASLAASTSASLQRPTPTSLRAQRHGRSR